MEWRVVVIEKGHQKDKQPEKLRTLGILYAPEAILNFDFLSFF